MSEDIKKALRKLVTSGGFDAPMDRGIVLAVDKETATCQVQLVSNEAVLEDVQLKPVINDNNSKTLGFIIYPALQSFVTVGQIDADNTDVVVLAFTEIESIALDTATALKLLITDQGHLNLNAVQMVFNDGKNGGIPLVNPLTALILKLQQQLNTLSAAFKAHIHPVAGASTGLTVTPTPAPIAPLVKSADIENKIITQ